MSSTNVVSISDHSKSVRTHEGYEALPNEVRIMRALFKSKASMTIQLRTCDDPVVGRLAWFDINNIALETKETTTVVCPKHSIETWSYRSSDAANA